MANPLYQWLCSNDLTNRYFIIRHGESLANVAGLIVSSPENGVNDYGLSETGREQVRSSFASQEQLGVETLIVSSDFKRAAETAAIALECLQTETPVKPDTLLRERFFGELELCDSAAYDTVWASDAKSADHTEGGVESVSAVLERLKTLLTQLEGKHQGRDILLVSHGDTLQILQTGFEGVEPSQHRSLPHLNTAEIRLLTLK